MISAVGAGMDTPKKSPEQDPTKPASADDTLRFKPSSEPTKIEPTPERARKEKADHH